MAVLTPPLSASEVQKAKPAAKDYELFDGQGLTLFVRTTGKKIWRFRYKRRLHHPHHHHIRLLPRYVACQRPHSPC